MKIVRAEAMALDIPFYADHVVAAMHRANTHSERVHLYRLETANGLVGYGDVVGTLSPVDHLVGKNPYQIMHDDAIGMGPQIAVLDLAGQDAGVPIHHLIGTKVRDRCPVSWWGIDMPPADWAKEAKESLKRGYTTFKMKARPWRDIHEQIETVGKVVPEDYRFDIDFNGFLLTPANAEVHLQKLDEHINVGMYESPYYLGRDLEGAKILRQRVRKFIVDHFNEQILHAHASDGFVVGSTLQETIRAATLASEFRTPFWLQLVGTGITTAYAAHLGAVLLHAQLPSITCHELFESDLLTERIDVVDGYMPVPDEPGLGVTIDEKAIEKYRVDPESPSPKDVYRSKKRILTVGWPGNGSKLRKWKFTDEGVYQFAFYKGNLPGFQTDVDLAVEEDDGSDAFAKEHQRILEREATIVQNQLR
ncbi:MAG: enolase C-terminal domain-like protein [Candidatus Latescibacterota bacterium]|nr:enolase C-terminal domain-like protein [Candidatus Latescibacterota bacterium]